MRIVWIIAWILVGLWSLFLFGAYGLVEMLGRVLSSNADKLAVDPETVVLIANLAGWMRSIGGAVIALVWAFGTALMLLVPWLLGKARRTAAYPTQPMGPIPSGPIVPTDRRLPR